MSDWLDDLDNALDEALASYGIPPESQGLEQRVLKRVNQRAARARRLRLSAVGVSVAAAACLIWWISPRPALRALQERKPALVARTRELLPEPAFVFRNSARVLAVAARPKRSRQIRREPKLLRFPSSSVAGNKELALLQLARYKTKNSVQEVSYLDSVVQPIQIAAIEIKIIELGSIPEEKK